MQLRLNLIIISLCSLPPPYSTMHSNPDTSSCTTLTIIRTVRAPNASDSEAIPVSKNQYQYSVKSFTTTERSVQVQQLERRINAHHPRIDGVESAMRLQASAAKSSAFIAVDDIFCNLTDRELFLNDVDQLSAELQPRTRAPCKWKGYGRPGTANEGLPGKTKPRSAAAKKTWNALQLKTHKSCIHACLSLTPERSTCVFLSFN